jgi:plastocyanin
MGMRTGRRWVAGSLAVLALLAAGCGDDSGDDAKASDTTATTVEVPDGIVVGAGINDPKDANLAVLEFLPAKVTVEVGTPVRWEWNGTEPHSVTFVPEGQEAPNVEADPSQAAPVPATGPIDGTALVSSGLQPLGAAPTPFETTFAKAGTYEYLCLIHPNMTGEVDVVEQGADADSPADVAEARASDTADYLAELRAAKADLVKADPVKEDDGDGTSTWTIEMGRSTEHGDVLAFAPTPAKVKAGDTVTFVNNSQAPHTASFFGTGSEQIQSPFDPKAVQPSPGPSPQALSPEGYINTGWLPPDAGPPLAQRSFSFTVPAAGTYAYVCILHAPSEMVGTIEAT